MKTKDLLGKSRILYCVDPYKLTIKLSNIIQLLNKRVRISTYENFHIEHLENDNYSQASFNNFPVEVDGLWYFETEDEAKTFVKKQMGFHF